MDDKIQNKWDQFKQKEEEYLKMNEQIEARRKNIQDKMQKQQGQEDQQQNIVEGQDEDYDDKMMNQGSNLKQNNYNDDYEQDGEYDEFGMNENEYDQDEQNDDQPDEFSNRDYINKIIHRVNKEGDNHDDEDQHKQNQNKYKKNEFQINRDFGNQNINDDEDDDDEDIDADKLLKKQEQLQEKLSKYKKIDSKKQEEYLELEMMVEEQQKIIRVQRIRKDGLLGEIESLTDTLKMKENILNQLGEKGKSFEEETESYSIQINLLTDKMEQTKQTIGQFNTYKQQEEKQSKTITYEIESVKKEIKKKGLELNKKDIKINRLQEEIDKIKMNLQMSKGNNTSGSDKLGDANSINQKLNSDIKKLDRQIIELLNAFKKQLRLIDILKRQKNHLIAGQIFAYTEEQFLNAIEMGNKI